MLKSFLTNSLAAIFYYTGIIAFLRFLGRNYVKIVLYHSVTDSESDFIKGTHVSTPPSLFRKHLNYIQKHYNILSLQKVLESLKHGKVHRRSLVITLDDGFADNYHCVYWYLQEHKLPATIFLVSDCILKKKPIWIQELCYIINSVGPEKIIEALSGLEGTPVITELPNRKASRKQLHGLLIEYFAYFVHKDVREALLTRIYHECNLSKENIIDDNQIFLNVEQIKEMARNGIDFGSHGATHTPFSAMSIGEQEEEINTSKLVIKEIIGHGAFPFAYPFGGSSSFKPSTRAIAERVGHSCILSTVERLNDSSRSPYELGRIRVDNISVYKLAFELEKGVLKRLLRIEK